VVLHTMSWSAEFAVASVAPATGAVLRLLAASTQARTIVEIGTGLGVSGLWLLQGMRPDAVLTSIDADPDHQAMARQSFAAAGFAPGRVRLITGRAGVVLPRLADAAYDLVFVDGDPADNPLCTFAARRLLRDHGLVVLHQPPVEAEQLMSGPEWSTARLGPDLLAATKTALPSSHSD
jgi:predicted O-methyltransferase YrrM